MEYKIKEGIPSYTKNLKKGENLGLMVLKDGKRTGPIVTDVNIKSFESCDLYRRERSSLDTNISHYLLPQQAIPLDALKILLFVMILHYLMLTSYTSCVLSFSFFFFFEIIL